MSFGCPVVSGGTLIFRSWPPGTCFSVIPSPGLEEVRLTLGEVLSLSELEQWPGPVAGRGQADPASGASPAERPPSGGPATQPHLVPGLEVQSTHLTEASTEGYVFTMPRGHPEGPGHIRIPAGEVKRLLGKGG